MPNPPSPWPQRWTAIESTLYTLLDRYGLRERGTRRENTIGALLNQLLQFGRQQFWFFYDGLTTRQLLDLGAIEDDARALTASLPAEFQRYNTGHPIREHVLAVTLSQIMEDAAVLQRASEQRDVSAAGVEAGRVAQEAIFYTLEDVDKLTYAGLKLLRPYLSPEETFTVLTYFRRSANVRVLPYAPVALIGVPLTAVDVSGESGVAVDLLAIPHELGHHLYWNGTTDGSLDLEKRFYRVIPEQIAATEVGHWTEEIFADVVGCLIGGPAVARSFLEMQLQQIGARFVNQDDVHPTPALRPYLYGRILQRMGLAASAGELFDVWEAQLAARRVYPNRVDLADGYRAVDIILDHFDRSAFVPAQQWSGPGAYADLYADFEARWRALADAVEDAEFDPASIEPLPDWSAQVAKLIGNPLLDDLPAEWYRAARDGTAAGAAPLHVPADVWLKIFDFGGWTTEGPNIKGHG